MGHGLGVASFDDLRAGDGRQLDFTFILPTSTNELVR